MSALQFFADEPALRAVAGRAPGGRARLYPARPVGDRAFRRRGAAHQARDRTAARAARRDAVRARRTDDRAASVGRREADDTTATVWSSAGNTVIVVEHDMGVVAASDWIIDIGPGAGDEGGHCRGKRHASRRRESAGQPDRSLSCKRMSSDDRCAVSLNGEFDLYGSRRSAQARSVRAHAEQSETKSSRE